MLEVFVVVLCLGCVWLFETQWTAARQSSLSSAVSWSLLKCLSIDSVMPSNHLVLSRPLLLPSIFLSIRVFPNESVLCIRCPNYWSFSFSISPSNEYSGFISFRIECFDILAIQGTLSSLLQHHSLKASILKYSAFFTVQLSHPYMTTEKKHNFDYMDLYRQSNVSAFSMLSMLVIVFLTRSKHVLNLLLQSPSAVILEPRKIKYNLYIYICIHIYINGYMYEV